MSCRIVLTRESADNARLAALLPGLDCVDYPAFAIEALALDPLLRSRLESGAYATLVVVSKNGVKALLSQTKAGPPPCVVALGEGTAQVLRAGGWPVTGMPSTAYAETLAEELEGLVSPEGRVLYVRGEIGSRRVPEKLRAEGREVDEAVVYRTVDPIRAPLAPDPRRTLFVFASPSSVRHFLAHNPLPERAEALCIGATTEAEARRLGFAAWSARGPEAEAIAEAVRTWAFTPEEAPR